MYYVYVCITTIYLKTGVPENPLPVTPEIWNFSCSRFGQRLDTLQTTNKQTDTLQNFRPLTQF